MAKRVFMYRDHGKICQPSLFEKVKCPGDARVSMTDLDCPGEMVFVDFVPFSNPRRARMQCNVCGVMGTIPVHRDGEVSDEK